MKIEFITVKDQTRIHDQKNNTSPVRITAFLKLK